MKTHKVKSSEELFKRWQDLANIFDHAEFGAIVQNDMEITIEQLEEWMSRVDEVERSFSGKLRKLYFDTLAHIRGPVFGGKK